MEFKILGPLEASVGSQRLDLGGTRQQIVLAALLLSANTVVRVGRLEEALYGEDLPPTSRSQAQIGVSALRRLFAAFGYPAAITTHGQGYVIAVGDAMLDSLRFADLVATARTARDAGQLDLAVAGYRDALRLWRGPALDGLDSRLLQAAAGRLDEQRAAAIEDRLELELDLGRHHEIVGELGELIEVYPLRERLRGQLMLALYRCDRTAEALEVYQQARRTLVEELGIEPGERLQRLQRSILTSDPALDPPAAPVRLQPERKRVPSMLPAGIGDFTGREGLAERIARQLTDWGERRRTAPVVVITGQGGVGKTSLAVHTAHDVVGHFPDGQLFASLRAGAGQPVSSGRILERFLRALGVSGSQIPEDMDERAEVYRDLVADRKVLVVLDDAAAESQVVPLLPGTEAGAVLITSRRRLGGLAGAFYIDLDVLDPASSLELLGRIAGPGRLQAQPEAAAAVVRQCGRLPLAIRVAGARLADRPHWDIQRLADRLADQARRLDELRHGDLAVRASISLTYESASEHARRLLRRLALVEAPAFSGWMCAALLGQSPAEAEDVLDELISARLVEATGTSSDTYSQSYRLHDLIRVYAWERLTADEPPAERGAALQRLLGGLLYLARQADYRYYGHDDTVMHSDATVWPLPDALTEQLVSEPTGWFERDRVALVAGVTQAARIGLTDLCWSLAIAAASMFQARGFLDDWRETHEVALQAARKAGDARGQAAILYTLGALGIDEGRFDEAREQLTAAVGLFEGAGDEQSAAMVTVQLAAVDRLTGRLDDAVRRGRQALTNLEGSGVRADRAYALRIMARAKMDLGELDVALELLAEALALARAAGSSRTEAHVLNRIGEVYLLAGEPDRAAGAFERGLAKARDAHSPLEEGFLLLGMGAAKIRLGDFDQARSALRLALQVATTGGERLGEARALRGLGDLALASGEPGQAVVLAVQATATFRDLGAQPDEVRALTLLSDAHAALGDSSAADAASARAAALRALLTAGTH